MKLPKESTLWKLATIGFGLIAGVSVIALMNALNNWMTVHFGDFDIAHEDITELIFSNSVYLIGKGIAIASGGFTTGAVIKLVKPSISYRSSVLAGIILTLLSLIDISTGLYPVWYQIFALLVSLPMVVFGSFLIEKVSDVYN